MRGAIAAVICGAVAIIPGSLCLIVGSTAPGFIIIQASAGILGLTACALGMRASRSKGAPSYVPGLVGFFLGIIALCETFAAVFLPAFR